MIVAGILEKESRKEVIFEAKVKSCSVGWRLRWRISEVLTICGTT